MASMLEANGIPVCVGASGHGSAEVNSLALGGYRLWIPASHHRIATELLIEVLDENEWEFSKGLRRAVLKFLALWGALQAGIAAIMIAVAGAPAMVLLAVPLDLLMVPVNPQARGDYFLYPDDAAGS